MEKTINIINNSNITRLPCIIILASDYLFVTNWGHAAPVRPHWRFYWNPVPGAEVSDEYQNYCLEKNIILAIPPGIHANQKLVKPSWTLYVHADIDIPLDESILRIMSIPVGEGMKNVLDKLTKLPGSPLVVGEFIYAVISRLPENIWRQQVTDTRIELVCRLLREHPEKNWGNPELAQKANFSENAFIRRFREVTGVPPQRYLLKQRLNRAAALLLENELSIDEIALSCGFCDRNYLSKMFRKHFGLPPGRFRAGINVP